MKWTKTYSYWFDTFKRETKLDNILYVNTSPDECFNRINKRNRVEEVNKIDLEYLKKCDEKHKLWLYNNELPLTEIDGNREINEIYSDIDNLISKLNIINKLNSC